RAAEGGAAVRIGRSVESQELPYHAVGAQVAHRHREASSAQRTPVSRVDHVARRARGAHALAIAAASPHGAGPATKFLTFRSVPIRWPTSSALSATATNIPDRSCGPPRRTRSSAKLSDFVKLSL